MLPLLVPVLLRCESLVDPLALQTAQPELSWKLEATDEKAHNVTQSAYQIVVSSSPELLRLNKGDLWDTGKVKSSETFGIKYLGKSLVSRSHAWWKVRVWDQKNQASEWSKEARFSTGLLEQSDWKGEWIHGSKPYIQNEALENAKWIWPGEGERGYYPEETVTLEKKLAVRGADNLGIVLSVDDSFKLYVNDDFVGEFEEEHGWKKPQKYDLTKFISGDEVTIRVIAKNRFYSPAGLIANIKWSSLGRDYYFVSDESWTSPQGEIFIQGEYGDLPWESIGSGKVVSPAYYFQNSFDTPKKVKRAMAYVTSLGVVDFELNGKKVSDAYFSPGWTNYNKRVYYSAHDITNQLKGSNYIQAIVSQGWYSGYVAWAMQREHYGEVPMLKAQIEIEYEDGTKQTLVTDKSWTVSTGPILDEHFLHGEKFDARLKLTRGQPVQIGNSDAVIEAFPGVPVVEEMALKPQMIKKIGDKKFILDFGQNLSGFLRLKVNERPGTKITMRFAERLDANGYLYTSNLRLAEATDVYICSGKGLEVWNPRFTFHGFQYAEIEGLESVTEEMFEAISVTSATPRVGYLTTSDEMINKLINNAWWTQKMNFVDIPTDCPQRDERLGWTGDAQVYVKTATYFADVQSFFKKWLVALDDDQREDGNYPKVAPVLKTLDDGGPAWSEAGMICPTTIYQTYGDLTLLRKHYPQMKKYVDFLVKRSKPNLLPPDQYHCYGDWLNIDAETPHDVIYMAYFAYSCDLLVESANELGYEQDVVQYNEISKNVKKAFQDEFVTSDGIVKGDTQCAYVLALGFDLLTETQAKMAEKHLITRIEERDWHLSTGFVGTRDLMRVLSEIGRSDVAFRLLHNKTFPSWGFPIANGATSIWERWDGWTPEKGFQNPGMNSFAHYAYGSVAGWIFEQIGGIKELEPGFRKVLIAPQIDPELEFSKASYDSIRGEIKVEWRKEAGKLILDVVIPPNMTAVIQVPVLGRSVPPITYGSGRHIFNIPWVD